MRKILALLLIFNITAPNSNAQIHLEPIVGYSVDLNNSSRFTQINSAVQAAFQLSKPYELILKVQKTWPGSYTATDSSFTLNTALPLYAPAQKIIQPSSSSIALVNRILVAGANTNNRLALLLSTGLTFQKFSVRYSHHKTDYTVLNPDKTLSANGLFFGGGVAYMRLLKTGRLFFQLEAATAPVRKKFNYPSSFSFMAPLSFNAGYSVLLKNK